MIDFSTLSIDQLIAPGGFDCDCGMHHDTQLQYVKIGAGAVRSLPEACRTLGVRRPFAVCDERTEKAAWQQARAALEGAGIEYALYTLRGEHLEPNESAVGSLAMAFDPACDAILAIGSGVINDTCKVLAKATGRPSLVVGTAPSMDGYASNSSSMIQNGIKVTLYNHCPAAIIADTDIMRNAPMRMLWAGLGDMLAKYVSACEWRIAHIVVGDEYCEKVAALMRRSLAKIVAAAGGLAAREPAAIEAVAEGLILSGMAMSFAKSSRPASGLEHYFSHMWEMMALERGEAADLHGIQVGVGTYLTFQVYERIRGLAPCGEKARAFVRGFDHRAWEAQTRRVFGSTAPRILEMAAACRKNEIEPHEERLTRILANWGEIQAIIAEEMPPLPALEAIMRGTGMPMVPEELHIAPGDVRDAFIASRDIRDKYLSCTLLWDLGLLYEFADALFPA